MNKEILEKAIKHDPALNGFSPDDLPESAKVRIKKTMASLERHFTDPELRAIEEWVGDSPKPIKSHEYDRENSLDLFGDGSLYVNSSADSEVWCFASDFLTDRLDEDKLTAGERDFFGITIDAEDASDFVITVRGSYYGPIHPEILLSNENYEIEVFANEESAKKRIEELEDTGPILHLGHNQYAADQYILTPRR
jgi:hypothetical protein